MGGELERIGLGYGEIRVRGAFCCWGWIGET